MRTHIRFPQAAALTSVAVLTVALTGCNSYQSQQSGQRLPPPQVQQPVQGVQYGQVTNIEFIRQTTGGNRPTGMGLVVGAAVGAALGNQIGSGSGRALATTAGAVGGAVAGHQIEGRNSTPEETYEAWRIHIRMNDGSMRTYDVSDTGDLRTGDRVRVDGNQISRL